jgi:hypothetical protein
MLSFVSQACAPIRRQYDKVWGAVFSQEHLKANFYQLADPKAPTGYMYYVCRWFALAQQQSVSFAADIKWLQQK